MFWVGIEQLFEQRFVDEWKPYSCCYFSGVLVSFVAVLIFGHFLSGVATLTISYEQSATL
jgi:hypothetical protein